MAVKTWSGRDGVFAADANWMQEAAPVSGDTAVITAGTVTAAGMLPGFLTIALNTLNGASPALILSAATLAATDRLTIAADATGTALQVQGTVNNQGSIAAGGGSPGLVSFRIGDRLESTAATFINSGSVLVSVSLQVTAGSNLGDRLENDGLISIRSPGKTPQLAYVSSAITGVGTVSLGRFVTFEAASAVGAGQNFVFEPGSVGATTLRIDVGALFGGTVTGFGMGDTIQLASSRWDTAAYRSADAYSGMLTLSLGGVVVQAIAFKGAYTIASFGLRESVPFGGSQASTAITLADRLFDAGYYLRQNPDVAAAGVDPYQHFMNYGWREGRDPSLLFSVSKYLAANLDVNSAALNPLLHYELYGRAEGRAALPVGNAGAADLLIDPAYYAQQLGASIVPAGIAGQQQASWSYDATGWRQGLNPNALFDTNYYLAQNPDVRAAGIDPLKHYEAYGWREQRDPSLLFSTGKYLAANPDVRAVGAAPLPHYLQYGQNEGRMAFLAGPAAAADPLIDPAFYDRQLGATLIPTDPAAQLQAAANYGATGWRLRLDPDAFFNTNYYLSHNADVAAAQLNPVRHYEQYGWREGRDPSAQFSITKYLAAYPDVRAANMDPLQHFLAYGQSEGRVASAV
jgi:hypothetical protein